MIAASLSIATIQQREMRAAIDHSRLLREGFGKLQQLRAFFRFHDAAECDHDAKGFFIRRASEHG